MSELQNSRWRIQYGVLVKFEIKDSIWWIKTQK